MNGWFGADIEDTKTICFSENLAINGLQSSLTKGWTAHVRDLAWTADFAVCNSITYSVALAQSAATDVNVYVVLSDLSGQKAYLGTFLPMGVPSSANAGMCGSDSNPQTLIKISRPITDVTFQILAPSTTADNSLVSCATSTYTNAPNGSLAIVITFIKLRDRK